MSVLLSMCFLDTEKHCRLSSFKFLNWNIIALHCWAVFHRTTQISHNYICLLACSGASAMYNSLWPYGSSPGSSVHDVLQARILKWIVMPSSRGSSQPGIKSTSPVSSAFQILYPLSHLESHIYVCVCIYIYMCVCVYIYIYIYMYIYTFPLEYKFYTINIY